ncbi:MAG: DnaT-like ssDNA-binding protein [Thiomicrorhabdus sp.]|nr:DnaT-like ssDNA-binding protein [Thiomicrorhabdus sp.]
MAVTVGTDVYISLADADAYFTNRLYATTWTGATDGNKEAALRMATIRLEQLDYVGLRADTDTPQALKWPRTSLPLIDGVDYSSDTTIPTQIANACAETALAILENDITTPNANSEYSRVKLSGMEVEYKSSQSNNTYNMQLNPFVWGYLSGFTETSGVIHG